MSLPRKTSMAQLLAQPACLVGSSVWLGLPAFSVCLPCWLICLTQPTCLFSLPALFIPADSALVLLSGFFVNLNDMRNILLKDIYMSNGLVSRYLVFLLKSWNPKGEAKRTSPSLSSVFLVWNNNLPWNIFFRFVSTLFF